MPCCSNSKSDHLAGVLDLALSFAAAVAAPGVPGALPGVAGAAFAAGVPGALPGVPGAAFAAGVPRALPGVPGAVAPGVPGALPAAVDTSPFSLSLCPLILRRSSFFGFRLS
mgnify:CR=1 FL=1